MSAIVLNTWLKLDTYRGQVVNSVTRKGSLIPGDFPDKKVVITHLASPIQSCSR
jgi:hypothetical protein